MTIACEPVLCDAHLGLHKNNVVAQIGGGLRRCFGGEPGCDRQPRRQASAGLFSTTPSLLLPVCVCRQSAPQLFVHRTRRLALAAWEARMAALCRMHCTVTFGEASQPSSLPLTLSSLFVFGIFFSGSAFLPLCFSASSPLLHCLRPRGFAIESEKGHGALQLARSIGLCAVSC